MHLHLVGDSQLRRFNSYCRKHRSRLQIHPIEVESGTTINRIRAKIKMTGPTMDSSQPFAVFIGTNDLKSTFNVKDMIQQFLALMKLIRTVFHPSLIIIVSLPMYPKYKNRPDILSKIVKFNQFLFTLGRPNHTSIIRWPQLSACNFFEATYTHGRVDLVHLSNEGLQYLELQLLQVLGQ